MARESASASGENIGDGMQKVIVSMVRFSCAFALYGVEQVETAVSPRKGEGFPRAIEDLEATLESMTDSLAQRMDRSNRETVKSATKIAEQVVEQSCEGLSLIDPRPGDSGRR